MEYRTTWSITLPSEKIASTTETQPVIDFLTRNHGIVSEVSSAENREPPLIINGTLENNGTRVQCVAINLVNPTRKCPGKMVMVAFFGKA
jgi:hypothetical protein